MAMVPEALLDARSNLSGDEGRAFLAVSELGIHEKAVDSYRFAIDLQAAVDVELYPAIRSFDIFFM